MYQRKESKTLATDLDGTFIPFDFLKNDSDKNDSRNVVRGDAADYCFDLTPFELQVVALKYLSDLHARGCYQLLYVTGRDEPSVMRCIREEQLPEPDFIFCDVGTNLLRRKADSSQNEAIANKYQHVDAFHLCLREITNGILAYELEEVLQDVERIILQEPSKQGTFKRSYYCKREYLDMATAEIRLQIENNKIPYQAICSIDPFNGDGLIDLLPRGVDKGFALKWWAAKYEFPLMDLVYAGDSGNDMAAFRSGARSIVVGNATKQVISEVLDHHRSCKTEDRIHVARHAATLGVLEGCKKFGIVG